MVPENRLGSLVPQTLQKRGRIFCEEFEMRLVG
jgi:hypothetical protein